MKEQERKPRLEVIAEAAEEKFGDKLDSLTDYWKVVEHCNCTIEGVRDLCRGGKRY